MIRYFRTEMRPAGVSRRVSDDSCSKNLQPDIFFPPPAGRQKPLKAAYSHNVPDIVHGISTIKSESVGKTFKAMRKMGVESIIRDRDEEIYKSTQLEPLGKTKSQICEHSLPHSDHVYGKKCPRNAEGTIKEAFNPACDMIVPPKDKLQYNWPPQVDSKFVFGFKDRPSDFGNIENALKWDKYEQTEPAVKPRLHKYGALLPEDHTFGLPSYQGLDSAAACISTNFARIQDLLPDKDIGKPKRARESGNFVTE